MKAPSKSSSLRPRSALSFKLLRLLSCGVAAASLWSGSAHATPYYWDTNGTVAGAGATPTGTWDGTNQFFNTDSNGGNGTFVSTLTSADTAQFVAGPGTAGGSGSSDYTVTVTGTQVAGALLFRSIGNTTIGASVGAGTISLGGAATTLDQSVRSVTVSGNTTATNFGTVTINSNLAFTAANVWSLSSLSGGGNVPSLAVNGAISGSGDLTVNQSTSRITAIAGSMTQTGNVTFQGTNATINVSGNVGHTGNLNVAFSSATSTTVSLTRAAGNNYGGTTNITGGTLNITNTSNSATSTGAVNLSGPVSGQAAGGTISGSGISTGLLTVTNGGQISPGAATTASTIRLGTSGGMTLTSATLNFNLSANAAAGNDQIVTGALTLGSTLTVNLAQIGATGNALSTSGTYTLIDASSATALDLTNVAITTNYSGFSGGSYTANYSSNATGDLLVSFAPVPEPSTWAAGALALLLVGWNQRRRFVGGRA